MLVEQDQLPAEALPIEALSRHLRLGTGLDETALQEDVLSAFLRAALAAVEGRTGKALIARAYLWRVEALDDALTFPVAPVRAVISLAVIDGTGGPEALDPAGFGLRQDAVTPQLRPLAGGWPALPSGGHLAISFEAGLGASFSDLPADLQQAVLMLAAHYYEFRGDTALDGGCMPFGVSALLARYLPVRLGLGA